MQPCTSRESDRDVFLQLAEVARKESHDPSTQNAAAVAFPYDPVRVYRPHANRFPARLSATARRTDRPAKYGLVEHAERAAIYDYAGDTTGCWLYVLWAACPDCARAIVARGFERVITLEATAAATPARWSDAVATGLGILRDSGVTVSFFAGKLDTSIRFDGKELKL